MSRSTKSARFILICWFLLAAPVWGQPAAPPEGNVVTTPEQANRGGMGLYLISQGNRLLKERRYEEAAKTFQQAVKLKPNAEAYLGLGRAYGWLNRWPEAVPAFEQAVKLKPGEVDPQINLGYAYGVLGRNAESARVFKEAVRLEPQNPHAHYGLGLAYWGQGDRPRAQAEYRILEKLDANLAQKLAKHLTKAPTAR